ncbi:potassium transporter Kup [Mycolicibacterium mucogenicum]|uniref:Probable potassium transport system protein Kup n=1 Tax=Mycolicibacterium mucogenicum DSM 44124 TaxID=1226753 RepID=A0A8E4RB18_MYCMU|nr:potassium transporter Kup [Mycolicibacterium mucogenicum]KAB7754178.1 potassium transporter Kup [Mycolicibacterium mucogenicum DSM 44124]QPG70955.1 potassium transporter Kup [Mycolicibacterium mucogenicum DSM 44124]
MGTHPDTGRKGLGAGLAISALGVVFGDIGTSPIYTMQTLFNPDDPHPVPISHDNIYGVVSLVFWSVMLIVTITYVSLVMRADNDGEGGVMALITLVKQSSDKLGRRTAAFLAALGILGAALFFGDSMITPAISVLSAVEGSKTIDPGLADWVVPITAVIIIALFSVQHRGTAVVGKFFGPVMVVWFTVIGACGVGGIIREPEILRALNPLYALGFMAGHFHIAFFALAAVVLSVTGAEALYADMGHFGRKPITFAWLLLVFPACMLSYFGQGALLLQNPSVHDAPFFLLTPEWGRLPMVLLATAATVIASQAVITGAFSVAAQAAHLGYLPRLRILHTSASTMGQIYVPWINSMLLIAVLTLVFAFRSSAALGYAYGMAVTGTITITTLLFLNIARARWDWPLWSVVAIGAPLLTVDVLFLAANLTKLVHGAWLPLLIGLIAFTVMTTWQDGRAVVTRARDAVEGPLRQFVESIVTSEPPLTRVPGTAVFLNRGIETAPLAMRANVKYNRMLHEHVVVLSLETATVPRIADGARLAVDDLGHRDDGIIHVTATYGYMDRPDVPAALALLDSAQTEGPLDLAGATYFLSKVDLVMAKEPSMAPWRTKLFIGTSYITSDAAAYFRLPLDRTVILGSRIEV